MASAREMVVDSVSGYPQINLSFMLNLFAPIRHLNVINDNTIGISIKDEIYRDFPNNEHIYHELTGKTFEGLIPPKFYNYTKDDVGIPMDFSEVQKLVSDIALANDNWIKDVQRNLSVQRPDITWLIVTANKLVGHEKNELGKDIRFILDTKGCNPGYTRLKIVNPQTTDAALKVKLKPKSEDYFLSSSALHDDTKHDLIKKRQHLKELLSSISAKQKQVDISSVDQYLEDISTIKVNIALPCSSWPKGAQNWITRERTSGWLSRSLTAGVIKAGTFVIPSTQNTSENSKIEWEISFLVAERTLAETLNDVQRQVFVLLCLVVFSHFSETMNCYHLKTALFWTCEVVPQSQWIPENLGKCFLVVLDKVLAFVENGVFPHFFIPERNLMKHLKPNQKKEILKSIKDIRRDPVKHLLEFTEMYQLIFLPSTKEMKDLLSSILSDKVSHKKKSIMEGSCYENQMEVLDLLAMQYMTEHAYREAISTSIEYAAIHNKVHPDTLEAEYKIMSIAPVIKESNLLMIYNLLLEIFPESKHRLEMLSTLAEQYEKAYFHSQDASKKIYYRDKAEECFTCAITLPDCHLQTKVEYARFLHSIGQYKTAIESIETFLDTEEAKLSDTANAYGKADLKLLDKVLQKAVLKYNNFIIPSLALGHYVVTNSYRKLGNHEQAQVSLVKFKLDCDQLKQNGLWTTSNVQTCMFTLLGFTAEDMNLYDMAGESFEQAEATLQD